MAAPLQTITFSRGLSALLYEVLVVRAILSPEPIRCLPCVHSMVLGSSRQRHRATRSGTRAVTVATDLRLARIQRFTQGEAHA